MWKDSPLIMIWRRVVNFEAARSSAEELLKLSPIGRDQDTMMYDAGNVIIGLWGQQEFRRSLATRQQPVDELSAHAAAQVQVANQCSIENFRQVPSMINPATEFVFVAESFESSRARLSLDTLDAQAASRRSAGDVLPFFDDDGNLFSLASPSEPAVRMATGFAGPRLGNLMKRRSAEGTMMVGVNLMVSSMAKSESFYRDVLGLDMLQTGESGATFDVGTSLLTLRPESTLRLVKCLNKAGRLNGDWIVFYAQDIRAKMKELSSRGIKFPHGVEASATGQLAYFQDPDGYSLVLWQPPHDRESLAEHNKIDFFPALKRILSQYVD